MGSVIHRCFVQQHKVLTHAPSPYIKSRCTVSYRTHPGQHLKAFDNIHLTQKCRDLLNGPDIQFVGAHFFIDGFPFFLLIGHHHFLQFPGRGRKLDIQADRTVEINGLMDGRVAEIAEIQ